MSAKLANYLQKDEFERIRELQYAVDQFALIGLIQPHGALAHANEKFLQVSGFAQEEICKQPFHNLLCDESRKLFVEHVMPILSRGITWKGELCHVACNHLQFWTEATIVPILNADKSLRHYHFIAFEVTERKAVEQSLTNNSIFFTKLMELAPIGFFLADIDGRCTYINKIWTDTSGCRLRQALGVGWLQAVFRDDRPMVEEAWHQFVHNGRAFNCEYRYQHGSDRIVWVVATAERVDFALNTRTRFIRVEKDLTERRENEQLINEQRAQIVTASKMSALGEMAGGIAHEINNPLAILQLRARQIMQLVRPDMPSVERLIQAAENIRQTTDRIAAIVRSLRAIAREGHGDPFLRTPVRALVDDTLELCAARFKSHDIMLRITPFSPHLEVSCRSVELLQLLLNLLNNAFYAVEHLQERWVEVGVHDRGDDVEIWITDSGPGILPELQDKIFQPFYTTKPIGCGTGLGLSISRAVALDHHGDLWLDRECPHTRFILKIPKHPVESA
ncbi:MAG: PAS domain S-box protein [Pseudobdellovibrionaceae bacterium]|nr:PAS domain S-box protein [Pseudobdellovibrionaceae bacterium]